MFTKTIVMSVMALGLAGVAQAASVVDATGDFIPTYTGPHQGDLDVTSLSVGYNAATTTFHVRSTMAAVIDSALGGLYVIGVNTGTGGAPFTGINHPGIKFNKAIVVQKSGSAAISGVALPVGSATISGNELNLWVKLSDLPSTGFDPLRYGFSIWPRSGVGGAEVISDFAPENVTIAAVPEPASWAMMVGGFGLIGGMVRRRRLSFAAA